MTDIAPEFRITISGQITPEDVKVLAEQGVKTIVNNRPDGEEAGQPTSAEIEQACTEQGIAYKQVAFSNDTERPLHIFCRTGNRSSTILAAARERDLLDEE